MTAPYDPYDPDIIADPYPFYEWLREHAPVHHVGHRDIWVLSRHADVRAALRDHARFSSAEGVTLFRFPVPIMLSMDPPDHARLRRIVTRDFTPRAVEAMRGPVQVVVDRLLDEALGTGTVDLVAALAVPLPVTVIAAMLGVPAERGEEFKRWSDAVVDSLALSADSPPEALQRAGEGTRDLLQFFGTVIAERQEHPTDDLIGTLVRPASGEQLTPMELMFFCLLLMVAGNETTTNLLGNMVDALLRSAEQHAALRAEPSLVPAAIEEALRFDAPIQGLFRTTTTAVEVHGTTIPVGARVLLLFGSANRDPRAYDDPDVLDIRRRPDHLAFGGGIHLCLGAPVARLEAQVAVESLLRRTASIEPAGAGTRTANPILRGFKSLPVVLQPA